MYEEPRISVLLPIINVQNRLCMKNLGFLSLYLLLTYKTGYV